jgi:hypothetical protein
MPSWLDAHFALGFLFGCIFAALIYVADWYYHVKMRPRKEAERSDLKKSKPDNSLTGKLYERDRERHPEEYDGAPPSASLNPPVTEPPSSATQQIEAQPGPRTSDLPATQESPAPSTAMIDFTKPPPPPMPYTGPERRLRSDNPNPELRRRAEDRERWEDTMASQVEKHVSPPQDAQPRMTRAEERRLREQQISSAQSEQLPTDEG